MTTLYLDLRATARIVLKDAGVRAPVDKSIVTSSTLLEIELQRLLERVRAQGGLSSAAYETKRREAKALLGAMHLFPLGDEVVELARAEYPFLVLTTDSVHVATAQVIAAEAKDVEFWTHDPAAGAAAMHRGLAVRGLEQRA